MKCLTITFVLVFASITGAGAQQLWANTRAGMSVAQVKNLFPDAVPPVNPARSRSASRVLLTIPETRVADQPFRAAFIFRDQKLEKVGLVYTGAKEFDHLIAVYDAVLADMRARHGREARHRSERGEITNNEEHTWLFDNLTIQMSMTSFVNLDAIFAVRYQAKASNVP